MKVLELKNRITEIKDSVEELNHRHEVVELVNLYQQRSYNPQIKY
jgi:hypothetical protein